MVGLLGFRRKGMSVVSVLALHHARLDLCANNKPEFVYTCDSYATLLPAGVSFSVPLAVLFCVSFGVCSFKVRRG